MAFGEWKHSFGKDNMLELIIFISILSFSNTNSIESLWCTFQSLNFFFQWIIFLLFLFFFIRSESEKMMDSRYCAFDQCHHIHRWNYRIKDCNNSQSSNWWNLFTFSNNVSLNFLHFFSFVFFSSSDKVFVIVVYVVFLIGNLSHQFVYESVPLPFPTRSFGLYRILGCSLYPHIVTDPTI